MEKGTRKGSRKGCMRGKGGPQNSGCIYRGVRQRTWGVWVAEIREPNLVNPNSPHEKKGQRLWLGTFPMAVEAALSYDMAARIMYGPEAILNFPEGCSSDPMTTSKESYLISSPVSAPESRLISGEKFSTSSPVSMLESRSISVAKESKDNECWKDEDMTDTQSELHRDRDIRGITPGIRDAVKDHNLEAADSNALSNDVEEPDSMQNLEGKSRTTDYESSGGGGICEHREGGNCDSGKSVMIEATDFENSGGPSVCEHGEDGICNSTQVIVKEENLQSERISNEILQKQEHNSSQNLLKVESLDIEPSSAFGVEEFAFRQEVDDGNDQLWPSYDPLQYQDQLAYLEKILMDEDFDIQSRLENAKASEVVKKLLTAEVFDKEPLQIDSIDDGPQLRQKFFDESCKIPYEQSDQIQNLERQKYLGDNDYGLTDETCDVKPFGDAASDIQIPKLQQECFDETCDDIQIPKLQQEGFDETCDVKPFGDAASDIQIPKLQQEGFENGTTSENMEGNDSFFDFLNDEDYGFLDSWFPEFLDSRRN